MSDFSDSFTVGARASAYMIKNHNCILVGPGTAKDQKRYAPSDFFAPKEYRKLNRYMRPLVSLIRPSDYRLDLYEDGQLMFFGGDDAPVQNVKAELKKHFRGKSDAYEFYRKALTNAYVNQKDNLKTTLSDLSDLDYTSVYIRKDNDTIIKEVTKSFSGRKEMGKPNMFELSGDTTFVLDRESFKEKYGEVPKFNCQNIFVRLFRGLREEVAKAIENGSRGNQWVKVLNSIGGLRDVIVATPLMSVKQFSSLPDDVTFRDYERTVKDYRLHDFDKLVDEASKLFKPSDLIFQYDSDHNKLGRLDKLLSGATKVYSDDKENIYVKDDMVIQESLEDEIVRILTTTKKEFKKQFSEEGNNFPEKNVLVKITIDGVSRTAERISGNDYVSDFVSIPDGEEFAVKYTDNFSWEPFDGMPSNGRFLTESELLSYNKQALSDEELNSIKSLVEEDNMITPVNSAYNAGKNFALETKGEAKINELYARASELGCSDEDVGQFVKGFSDLVAEENKIANQAVDTVHKEFSQGYIGVGIENPVDLPDGRYPATLTDTIVKLEGKEYTSSESVPSTNDAPIWVYVKDKVAFWSISNKTFSAKSDNTQVVFHKEYSQLKKNLNPKNEESIVAFGRFKMRNGESIKKFGGFSDIIIELEDNIRNATTKEEQEKALKAWKDRVKQDYMKSDFRIIDEDLKEFSNQDNIFTVYDPETKLRKVDSKGKPVEFNSLSKANEWAKDNGGETVSLLFYVDRIQSKDTKQFSYNGAYSDLNYVLRDLRQAYQIAKEEAHGSRHHYGKLNDFALLVELGKLDIEVLEDIMTRQDYEYINNMVKDDAKYDTIMGYPKNDARWNKMFSQKPILEQVKETKERLGFDTDKEAFDYIINGNPEYRKKYKDSWGDVLEGKLKEFSQIDGKSKAFKDGQELGRKYKESGDEASNYDVESVASEAGYEGDDLTNFKFGFHSIASKAENFTK